MSGRWIKIGLLFLSFQLFGIATEAAAQPVEDSLTIAPNTFQFNNHKTRYERISFRLINNLIIIPLRINDSDTLHFILDTGVSSVIITEMNYIGSLTLHDLEKVEIKGLGEGLVLSAYLSNGNTIFLEGITGLNHSISILTSLDFMLSQHLGIPVHGLIGYDLFRQFVVKIDYDGKFISIYNRREFAPLKVRRRSVVLPFEFQGHKPLGMVKIKYPGENWLNVRLMLDLGASDAAWLSTLSHPAIRLPEKWVETYLGQGLSGDIWGKRGKIEAISVGHYTFNNPVIAYPDPELVQPLIEGQNRQGSLGSAVLQKFDIVIDYPGQKFILTPNSFFRKPFRYNKSGIEILTPFPGLPFYYVSTVTPGSAAYKAGVMKDDQILEINGLNGSEHSFEEMLDEFFGKDGQKVRMLLKRNGEKIKVSFELESMF